MKLFLHEFPSTEGICWESKAGVWVIRFDHWESTNNTMNVFNITFKWCDVKVNVFEIKILDKYLTRDENVIILFWDQLITLLSIFHKYDQYFWKPSAQIPRWLIKEFYAIVIDNPQ